MKNPDWHPKSLAELTPAQRRNLKYLSERESYSCTELQGRSYASLARHGLAELIEGRRYRITDKGRLALTGSGF